MASFLFESDQELANILDQLEESYNEDLLPDIPQILTYIFQEEDMETSGDKVFDNPDAGLKVILEKDSHIFRHAREVQTGSRGGYVEGFITLPMESLSKTIILELSVVPCDEKLAIHPHLLHLTVYTENQKRASYKTPLRSPSDWRLRFKIVKCKSIFHIPNNPDEKEVVLPSHCLSLDMGQPILTLGKNKVLVNIISSLQGATKRGSSNSESTIVTNFDVIAKRVEEELFQYPQIEVCKDLAKKLASKYTNKDHKVELQRCKLRVCFFDSKSPLQILTAFSTTINNARDKNVGYLNLRSISDPGMCCSQGGWRFFLISEHKLAKDRVYAKQEADDDCTENKPHPVVPKLELTNDHFQIITDPNIHLNQIPTDSEFFEVHGDTFSIVIPPQDPMTIDRINHLGFKIRIFLYRNLDKKHSDSSVEFTYVTHNEFNNSICPFCLIKSRMTTSLNIVNNGKSRKRTKLGTICERSPRESSPVFSPLSDFMSVLLSPISNEGNSSPQYDPSGFSRTGQADDFEFLANLTSEVNLPLQFETKNSSSPTGYDDNEFYHAISLGDLTVHPGNFSNVSLHLDLGDFGNFENNKSIVADSWTDDVEILTKSLDQLDLVKHHPDAESKQPDVIQGCIKAEKRETTELHRMTNYEIFSAFTFAMICIIVGSFGVTFLQVY